MRRARKRTRSVVASSAQCRSSTTSTRGVGATRPAPRRRSRAGPPRPRRLAVTADPSAPATSRSGPSGRGVLRGRTCPTTPASTPARRTRAAAPSCRCPPHRRAGRRPPRPAAARSARVCKHVDRVVALQQPHRRSVNGIALVSPAQVDDDVDPVGVEGHVPGDLGHGGVGLGVVPHRVGDLAVRGGERVVRRVALVRAVGGVVARLQHLGADVGERDVVAPSGSRPPAGRAPRWCRRRACRHAARRPAPSAGSTVIGCCGPGWRTVRDTNCSFGRRCLSGNNRARAELPRRITPPTAARPPRRRAARPRSPAARRPWRSGCPAASAATGSACPACAGRGPGARPRSR